MEKPFFTPFVLHLRHIPPHARWPAGWTGPLLAAESVIAQVKTTKSGNQEFLQIQPWSLFQTASVANIFLAKGRIVSTEGRFFDANSDDLASPLSVYSSVPIIVLISKFSVSASEVLAATLQENDRATLIGETCLGKGTSKFDPYSHRG